VLESELSSMKRKMQSSEAEMSRQNWEVSKLKTVLQQASTVMLSFSTNNDRQNLLLSTILEHRKHLLMATLSGHVNNIEPLLPKGADIRKKNIETMCLEGTKSIGPGPLFQSLNLGGHHFSPCKLVRPIVLTWTVLCTHVFPFFVAFLLITRLGSLF